MVERARASASASPGGKEQRIKGLIRSGATTGVGAAWALIPGALGGLLLFIRTILEDRTLQRELDGYREYAARVRYRLLPGVW
jgi:protein-S-isoprenylcysteine O-methyltransferase Ste14